MLMRVIAERLAAEGFAPHGEVGMWREGAAGDEESVPLPALITIFAQWGDADARL